MPDIDKWAGDSFPLSAWSGDVDPGVDTARLIADKPSSITVKRGASTLDAQTVRVEALGHPRQVEISAGIVAVVDTAILGYKGHPIIADTDLRAGDRFALAGRSYEIVMVMPGLVDSLQAYARARG